MSSCYHVYLPLVFLLQPSPIPSYSSSAFTLFYLFSLFLFLLLLLLLFFFPPFLFFFFFLLSPLFLPLKFTCSLAKASPLHHHTVKSSRLTEHTKSAVFASTTIPPPSTFSTSQSLPHHLALQRLVCGGYGDVVVVIWWL